jgi:protein-tyrosine phosphatase
MSREQSHRSILFVCTGNTCRSPIAEVLCQRLLAERLGCRISDLPERGYQVGSAGILALPGEAASPLTIEMLPELQEHRSRSITPDVLATATDVFALTRGHSVVLVARFPNVGPTPIVLGGHSDVADPIGGNREDYRLCARQIQEYLEPIVTGWLRA